MNVHIHRFFWYLTFFQLFYISALILLSYAHLQNKVFITISGVIVELLTIPVVAGVLFCIIYFGLKLFKTNFSKELALIFTINLSIAGIMILFTILQS